MHSTPPPLLYRVSSISLTAGPSVKQKHPSHPSSSSLRSSGFDSAHFWGPLFVRAAHVRRLQFFSQSMQHRQTQNLLCTAVVAC